jgi:hypothetical protein
VKTHDVYALCLLPVPIFGKGSDPLQTVFLGRNICSRTTLRVVVWPEGKGRYPKTVFRSEFPDLFLDPQIGAPERMYGIVPNFAAVSANTRLPPLSVREKFWLATQDSVDYSSFIWAGVLAGQSFALNSYPELGHGAAGYGRYYWWAFTDQASGAFFTEAIVPALRHEDPRYYTLGHGGFFRRTGYALSRVVLTKTDSGGTSFNFSEIVGNGMEAGLSNLYYPPEERGLRKTAENWGTGLESAALNNVIKEFWPDIRHKLLRQK